MKDEPLKECLCERKGIVTRMISNGTGIIFKGTGFYVTDYKKTSAPSETPTAPTTPSTTVTTPTTSTVKSES
jgi:predicted nucleic acid-binding Zn ribbon protein